MTATTLRLEDLVEFIRNGLSISNRNGVGGIPITRIETISEHAVDPTRVGYAGVQLGERDDWLLERGDILFSHINSVSHLGKVALYEGRPEHLLHGMNLLGIRPKVGIVLPQYLVRALRSAGFRAQLAKHIKPAVNQASVSISALKTLTLRIPDFAEQRRIVDLLDRADAIRRKRKEAIALTEELLRSAFLEMFGDPVSNPKGWPVKPLGEVVDLFAGNSLPSGVEFSGQCDGYLLMKVGDMNIPGNEVEVAVAREWAATVPSAAVIAPAGAVVIPKRGGAIATNKKRVLTRAAALDPNLMAIAPRASLQLDFLRQWFEGIDLAKLSNGSAVPQLNKKDLTPLTIPVPSSQSQVKFAECAKRIRAMRARAERGLAEADALFSGLVARAFAGELS